MGNGRQRLAHSLRHASRCVLLALACGATAWGQGGTRIAPQPAMPAADSPKPLTPFEKAARTPTWGPDDVVDQFTAQSVDLPTAVKMLSNEYHVLCGIEVIPWAAGAGDLEQPPLVSLTVSDVPVRYIMKMLVMQDPRFVWSEDNGVINVVMRCAAAARDYPLNSAIPEFEAKNSPFFSLLVGGQEGYKDSLFGQPEIRGRLGVGMGYEGYWEEPTVTLSMRNQTARAIINEVARKLKVSWSLEYKNYLSKAPLPGPIAWFWMQPRFPTSDPSACPQCVPWNSKRLLSLRESVVGPSLQFTWNADTQTAAVQRGSRVVRLRAGSEKVQVDGREVRLSTPAVLKDEDLLVPEYFVWALGLWALD
jgi:hypothetical protein